jgi:hypothetical protein
MSVFFKIFDDLFADHFAFETTESRFNRFVIINGYKSHFSFTSFRLKDTLYAEQSIIKHDFPRLCKAWAGRISIPQGCLLGTYRIIEYLQLKRFSYV